MTCDSESLLPSLYASHGFTVSCLSNDSTGLITLSSSLLITPSSTSSITSFETEDAHTTSAVVPRPQLFDHSCVFPSLTIDPVTLISLISSPFSVSAHCTLT